MSPNPITMEASFALEKFLSHCLMHFQDARHCCAYTIFTITTNSLMPEEIVGEDGYWLSAIPIQSVFRRRSFE